VEITNAQKMVKYSAQKMAPEMLSFQYQA